MTSHKPSMPHIRHNLTPVNNRYYLTGEEVPEGADWDSKSEWRTELVCECGYKLNLKQYEPKRKI